MEFEYNGTPRMLVFFSTFGLFVIVASMLIDLPRWVTFAGIVFLLFMVVSFIRMKYFKRKVSLNEQQLSVPGGFLRMFPRSINLSEVVDASEGPWLLGARVFTITTKVNKVEIISFLMNCEDYFDLSERLKSILESLKVTEGEKLPDPRAVEFLTTYDQLCRRSAIVYISFFIASIGQALLYGYLVESYVSTPGIVKGIGLPIGYLPFLLFFSLTFLKVPPISPQLFRRCLLFVMCWYGANTIALEVSYFLELITVPPRSQHAVIIGRVCMHIGWLGLLPLVYCYKKFLRQENQYRQSAKGA